jgi:hypothetical protein
VFNFASRAKQLRRAMVYELLGVPQVGDEPRGGDRNAHVGFWVGPGQMGVRLGPGFC